MWKRILLSTVVGGVVIFAQGAIFFGVLFADFFARAVPTEFAGINRDTPNFVMVFVADLVYAALLAILFTVVGKVETFRRGAAVGTLMGFATVLHFDLITTATTFMTTPPTVAANVALSTLLSGVGGGVIAVVLGRLKGPSHPEAA